MSFATFYSPFLIGLILGIGLTVVRAAGHWSTLGEGRWLVAPIALLAGLAWAIVLQLAMVGLQGVSAQVVPVVRGRSIRGRGAVAVGVLILVGLGLSGLGGLWAALSRTALTAWFWTMLSAGLSCLLAALITYLWCLPTADTEFVDASRRPLA